MKITVTSTTHPPVVLGDDSKREWIKGPLPEVDGIVQVAPAYRRTKVKLWGRGNVKLGWQWTVVRDHATDEAAIDFLLTHQDSVPEQGLIELSHIRLGSLIVRWMPDAYLRPHKCINHIGACTVWSYTALGAEILLTKPRS